MGKSIRIYLPNETVSGIRHAEIANWTGQAIACPRTLFSELREWPEVQRPGVYILLGFDDETGEDIAYVGEAEVLVDRLQNHLSGKDFWSEAVIFSSKDENLTKAHVRYLECRMISMAKEAKRYRIENSVTPALPSLPRADRDAMEEFLSFSKTLLSVLGYRLLDPLIVRRATAEHALNDLISNIPQPAAKVLEPSPVFHLRVSGIHARAVWTDEGMIVFDGSEATLTSAQSLTGAMKGLRETLIASEVLVPAGDKMRFSRDFMFKSPSQAAGVITGYSINGREHWKLQNGTSFNRFTQPM
jgi:hypothetical protein